MPHYNSVSVTLKFSPQVAFRVHDEFSDAITTDEENNLYVTANLPDHEVIYHYLLTFGEHVEVLSPAHIRDGIKEKSMLHSKKNMKHDTGFQVLFVILVLETENFWYSIKIKRMNTCIDGGGDNMGN